MEFVKLYKRNILPTWRQWQYVPWYAVTHVQGKLSYSADDRNLYHHETSHPTYSVIYVHLNVKEQYTVIWNVRSYVVCLLHWNNRKQHKQKFLCITHQLLSNVLLCHSSINTLFSIGEGSMNYVSVKTKSIMTVDKSQTGKCDLS